MSPELADAHASGDCGPDCPHPDCVWEGAVGVLPSLFDDPERAFEIDLEPLVL